MPRPEIEDVPEARPPGAITGRSAFAAFAAVAAGAFFSEDAHGEVQSLNAAETAFAARAAGTVQSTRASRAGPAGNATGTACAQTAGTRHSLDHVNSVRGHRRTEHHNLSGAAAD